MLAERIDSHRVARQKLCPNLTLTGIYNVLEKLNRGEALTAKEKGINEEGLISTLKQLHDELDLAVFDAYGWPHNLTEEQILERLVALNQERAEDERRGIVRWLRPEFQNPGTSKPRQQGFAGAEFDEAKASESSPTPIVAGGPWPKKLTEQIAAIRDLVSPGTSWSTMAAASSFKSAKVEEVQEVMESLAALGG